MTKREILDYEAASLWFTGVLPTAWMAQYVARKVNRKWRRYYRHIESSKIFESNMTKAEKLVALRELDNKLSNN